MHVAVVMTLTCILSTTVLSDTVTCIIYTVLCPKRLECALFQSLVIFSVILHAMHTLNIPK